MGFAGVCFEVSTSCPKCQQPLPLNGVSESTLCDKCRTPFPTPKDMWESILGDALGGAIASEVGTGNNSTIMGGYGTFKIMSGRQDPRCNPTCKAAYDPAAVQRGAQTGMVACGQCGKKAVVRAAPEWMRSLHPKLALLVGETMSAQVASAAPGSIKFHCYHCGGGLPLDGKERSVKCSYCNNQLVVPDEIWVRLHPTRTIDRWYAVLDLDVASAAGVLPEDCSDFCDFGIEPGGNLIVAWEDYDEGDVGHRWRLGLVGPDGLLMWKQDGMEFSDDTRLFVSPSTGTVWLVDPYNGFAREIDPRSGQPIRTLPSPPNDEANTLSVKNFDAFAIDWDGTFLVERSFTNSSGTAMRRYGPDGRRVPLWPGQRIKNDEDLSSVDWEDMPKKQFGRLPSSARFCVGWDGCLYIADSSGRHLAKYGRDGILHGIMPLPSQIMSNVRTVQASRDGTIFLLFEHKTKIGDDDWMHVARIRGGQIEIFLGAHVGEQALIGEYDDRMKVMPDGTVYVGHGLDCIRGYSPDGRMIFATPATRKKTKDLLEDLAKARRGKKLVSDRG